MLPESDVPPARLALTFGLFVAVALVTPTDAPNDTEMARASADASDVTREAASISPDSWGEPDTTVATVGFVVASITTPAPEPTSETASARPTDVVEALTVEVALKDAPVPVA